MRDAGPLRPNYESLRPGLVVALRADAGQYALAHGAGGRWWVLRTCLSFDDFLGVALYRLRTALRVRHVPFLPALINRFCIACWNLNIDDHVVVREGLCVPNGNVVLAGFSLVGRNVTIGPWATIGTRAGNFEGPNIGDGVFIGTHASILGTWCIGDGVTVSPGSVVVGDVAANETVAGVPARPVATPRAQEPRSTTG